MSTSSASVIVTASPAARFRQVAIRRDDARDGGFLAGRGHDDFVARPHRCPRPRCPRSRGNRGSAGSPTAPGSGTACLASAWSTSSASRYSSSVGPSYQRHALGALRDVLAEARRQRDRRDRREAERLREAEVVAPRCGGSARRRTPPGRSCSPPRRRAGCRAASRCSCAGASASARPCAHRSG